MRSCENCIYARCLLAPSPGMSDVWMCKARGGEIQTRLILRALTCIAYKSRYRLRVKRNREK